MEYLSRKQRGATLTGVLFALVLLAIFGTVAVKLTPHYLEFFTIKSAMDSFNEDPELVAQGKRAVLERINNQLYINNIDNISLKAFSYKPERNGFDLGVAYEVREHLFGNLDAVLTFEHQVTVDRQ